MNRETRLLMQRQGAQTRDKQEMARRMVQGGKPAKGKAPIPKRFTGYFKNVRTELKAVDWPTKTQVKSYATVVFATLVVVIGLIFLFNVVFAKAVSLLFG